MAYKTACDRFNVQEGKLRKKEGEFLGAGKVIGDGNGMFLRREGEVVLLRGKKMNP
jgi:hypothetical protein